MPEIRVRCQCGKGLLISAEQAGRTGRCPQCQRSVPVPAVSLFEPLAERGRLSVSELETLAGSLWRPGEVVDGRYQVREYLGHGGCGIVWKAQHTEWNIDLAVKEFIDAPDLTPERRERRKANFIRESQAWVDDVGMHPHVVTAWYVRKLNETPYLFLEYCDGGDLHSWIQDGRTRDLKTALDIAIQLAWGLAHCHEKGIVHRDFKPKNVMMMADGTAKITDFGMVKFAAIEGDDEFALAQSTGNRSTLGGGIRGTPEYMPPEQWERIAILDHRADLYALGVTLFEMLTGRFPIRIPSHFESENERLRLCKAAHTNDARFSLLQIHNDVPEALDRLVKQCLAKRVDDRPRDVHTVVSALLEIYEAAVGTTYHRPEPSEVQPLADQLNNKALSLWDLDNFRGAERLWKHALQADSAHLLTTFNLGLARWRSGRMTDSELLQQLEAGSDAPGLPQYLQVEVHRERDDRESVSRLLGNVWSFSDESTAIRSVLAEVPIEEASDAGLEGGRCVTAFDKGHGIAGIALSPDGALVFARHSPYSENRESRTQLHLLDARTGRCMHVLNGHSAHVNAVAFSPSGRFAASGSADRTIRIWDAKTGSCLQVLDGRAAGVTCVSFAPRDEQVVSADEDGTVRVWDIRRGRCVRELSSRTGAIKSFSLSHCGRFALIAAADTTVRLCSLAEGKGRQVYGGQQYGGETTCVAFSPDDRTFIATAADGTVRLWDVAKGDCLRTFRGAGARANVGCFTSDGRYALCGYASRRSRVGDGRMILWDVSTGQCLRTFDAHKGGVLSIAVCVRWDRVVSAGQDGTVRLWELGHPGQVRARFQMARVSTPEQLLDAESKFQAELTEAWTALDRGDLCGAFDAASAARSNSQYSHSPEAMSLWSALCSRIPRTALSSGWLTRRCHGHSGEVTSVSYSQDGRFAASGGDDMKVRIWDTWTGRCLHTWGGHVDWISSVSYSPDGRNVLSGSADGTVRLWQPGAPANGADGSGSRNRRVEWTSFDGHTGRVTAVTFASSDDVAVSASDDQTLRVWRIPSGECLSRLEGHTDRITSVAVSPCGGLIVSGSDDKTLRVWELRAAVCADVIEADRRGITAVAFSSDGKHFVAGGHGRSMRDSAVMQLLDVETGKVVRTHDSHSNEVSSLSFSPDGRFVLFSTESSSPSVWDLRTDDTFALSSGADGHSGGLNAATFSPDGCHVMSASRDGTVGLWFMDWELAPTCENRPSPE